MKIVSLVCVILIGSAAYAQDTSHVTKARVKSKGDIWAGDSVTITVPANGNTKEFEGIELYVKTRFQAVPLTWDSVTGEGFYEYTYTVGDFDAKPLPADYSNTKVRIISIKSFRDKENKLLTVFFCQGRKPNEVIWVYVEKAFFAGEIILPTSP
jgi:hypothetical protein